MNCETVVPEVNNEYSKICTKPLQISTEESTNTEECVNKTIIDKLILRRLEQVRKTEFMKFDEL